MRSSLELLAAPILVPMGISSLPLTVIIVRLLGSLTLANPDGYRGEVLLLLLLLDQGPYFFPLLYSPMKRGRKREAIALNDGIEAAKMPTLVSITVQYMAPLMAYVESFELSMVGI